jgi:hypothetical protein
MPASRPSRDRFQPALQNRKSGIAMRLLMLAAGGQKLAAEGLKEVTSPNANEQRGAEKEHGVETGAALTSPVDILFEVEPEGELVQSESGADTVEQGHRTAGEERRRLASRAHFDQPTKSDSKQKENPPDQVMDMRAANVNVVKRRDVAGSGESQRARHGKGDEESDGREEKPTLRPIPDMLVKKLTHAGLVQEQKDGRKKNG